MIYLPKFSKKIKVKWKKFDNIVKYKKKMVDKFTKSDICLAKSANFMIKKALLRAFNDRLKGQK